MKGNSGINSEEEQWKKTERNSGIKCEEQCKKTAKMSGINAEEEECKK